MNTNSIKPQVGQEVVVAHCGSWEMHYSFGYIVTKVTPSGQVTVMYPNSESVRKFDKEGYEMGSMRSKYSRDSLRYDVAELKEEVAKKSRANLAASMISAVRVEKSLGTYGKDGLTHQIAELEELLAKAKAAVEAI